MQKFSRYIGAEPMSKDPVNPQSRFVGANHVYAACTPGQPEYESTEGQRIRKKLSHRVKDTVKETHMMHEAEEKSKLDTLLKTLGALGLIQFLARTTASQNTQVPGPTGFDWPKISDNTELEIKMSKKKTK